MNDEITADRIKAWLKRGGVNVQETDFFSNVAEHFEKTEAETK